jgi:hypothetical protein
MVIEYELAENIECNDLEQVEYRLDGLTLSCTVLAEHSLEVLSPLLEKGHRADDSKGKASHYKKTPRCY